MKIDDKAKVDKFLADYEELRGLGISLELRHGKYGTDVCLVNDNACSPSDYLVAEIEKGLSTI